MARMLSRRKIFSIVSVWIVEGWPKRSSSWTCSWPSWNFSCDSKIQIFDKNSSPYAFFNLKTSNTQKVSVGVFLIFAQILMQLVDVALHDELRRGRMTHVRTVRPVLPHPPQETKTMPRQIQKKLPPSNPRSQKPAGSASLRRGSPIPGTYTDPRCLFTRCGYFDVLFDLLIWLFWFHCRTFYSLHRRFTEAVLAKELNCGEKFQLS